jgi:hypothetical protein
MIKLKGTLFLIQSHENRKSGFENGKQTAAKAGRYRQTVYLSAGHLVGVGRTNRIKFGARFVQCSQKSHTPLQFLI